MSGLIESETSEVTPAALSQSIPSPGGYPATVAGEGGCPFASASDKGRSPTSLAKRTAVRRVAYGLASMLRDGGEPSGRRLLQPMGRDPDLLLVQVIGLAS